MRILFTFTMVMALWLNYSPIEAWTTQNQGPCEDLSPHCAVLCAPCSEAETWPASSHETADVAVDTSSPENTDAVDPLNTDNANAMAPAQAVAEAEEDSETETTKKALGRVKRMVGQEPASASAPANGHGGAGWFSTTGHKPAGLPNWMPWPMVPQPVMAYPVMPMPFPPVPPPPPPFHAATCGSLLSTGRQLVESFCPKSCGRCGSSSNPLAAARAFVGAQCTAVQGGPVGLALRE